MTNDKMYHPKRIVVKMSNLMPKNNNYLKYIRGTCHERVKDNIKTDNTNSAP